MRSLVEEALAKDAAPAKMEMAPNFGYQQLDSTDAELIELLQKLKTNIKIVGCGGGGSNTINRISDENNSGLETTPPTLTHSTCGPPRPHKILLGRRSTRGLELAPPSGGRAGRPRGGG